MDQKSTASWFDWAIGLSVLGIAGSLFYLTVTGAGMRLEELPRR